MDTNYSLSDFEAFLCDYCGKPIFPMDPKTIDLKTGSRYCNSYCCDMDNQK